MAAEFETREDYEDSPAGWQQRWNAELAAAKKEVEKWHKEGEEVVQRFRDERTKDNSADTRWTLFTANVTTLAAMVYGKTPRSEVDRRFADAQDDVARVAAELWRRLLNTDIEREDDTYAEALQYARMDRLLAGLANCRCRYVAEFETRTVEARLDANGQVLAEGFTEEVKAYEDVEVDYVHWKDQLWSPARVFHEVRWWAFKVLMSREQLIARFGEDIGKKVPLNAKKSGKRNRPGLEDAIEDPWQRAEVWEIWCKENRKVYWYVEGHDEILDCKDDPLGLTRFWPFPKPIFANVANSTLVPRPDYKLAKDLYNEVDDISTRIKILQDSVRVVGAYDAANGALGNALNSTHSMVPQFVPVDNWAMFGEKGGIRGAIDFVPIEQVVVAMDKLREMRQELVQALYQVTGMGDVMRGQQMANGTPGEAQLKARYGSVRVQALQDEFARFASDLLRIKAEIIAKHFDARTIYERSNAQYGYDQAVVPQAIELMKSRFNEYRIEVKPEAISLTDYAQLKAERTEFLGALSGFLTAAGPLAQQMPGSLPFLLQMLQWTMGGLRGASTIEGVLDQAIQQAQKQWEAMQAQPQQSAPDPKLQQMQLKAQLDAQKSQADIQKTQAKLQADLQRIAAETQAKDIQEQSQARWNVQEAAAKKRINQTGMGPLIGPGSI